MERSKKGNQANLVWNSQIMQNWLIQNISIKINMLIDTRM